MKTIFPYLILLAFGYTMPINAQSTLPYRLEIFTEVGYTDLSNPTSLNQGMVWDDPLFTIPIGFDFDFFGETVNTLYIPVFFLGGTVASSVDLNKPANAIMAYGSDLIDLGYQDNNSRSPISYKTEGEPGDRILKLEWKNAGYYNEINDLQIDSSFVNLQMWVYEGSNDIELHFGPGNYFSDNNFLHDGKTGPPIGFLSNINYANETIDSVWYLNGPLINPVIEVTDIQGFYYSVSNTLDGNPADGTVYRFTTAPPVGVNSLIISNDLVRIYPTTVHERLYIEAVSEWEDKATIRISDALGRVLLMQSFDQQGAQLDLSNIPSGMYIVEIYTADKIQSQQFFRQ